MSFNLNGTCIDPEGEVKGMAGREQRKQEREKRREREYNVEKCLMEELIGNIEVFMDLIKSDDFLITHLLSQNKAILLIRMN